MLYKNVAGQKIHVYAYDKTTGEAKTGDAANITAYVSLDGTANAIDDTNPAEVDATNMPGVYVFALTAAETNGDSFALYAKSSTSNIRIEPIIGFTSGDGTAIPTLLTVAWSGAPPGESSVTFQLAGTAGGFRYYKSTTTVEAIYVYIWYHTALGKWVCGPDSPGTNDSDARWWDADDLLQAGSWALISTPEHPDSVSTMFATATTIARVPGGYAGPLPDVEPGAAGGLAIVGSEMAANVTKWLGATAPAFNGDAGIGPNVYGRTTYYVAKTGNDANDGLSWGTAKLTIQAAVTAATAGGELIIVGPGTFTEAVDLSAKTGVELRGSGPGTIITSAAATKTVNLGASCSITDCYVKNTYTPLGAYSSACIWSDAADVTVQRVFVDANADGIMLYGLRPLIEDCRIVSSEFGAYLYEGVIRRCNIEISGWTTCSAAGISLGIAEGYDQFAVAEDCVVVAKQTNSIGQTLFGVQAFGSATIHGCQIYAAQSGTDACIGIESIGLDSVVQVTGGTVVRAYALGGGTAKDIRANTDTDHNSKVFVAEGCDARVANCTTFVTFAAVVDGSTLATNASAVHTAVDDGTNGLAAIKTAAAAAKVAAEAVQTLAAGASGFAATKIDTAAAKLLTDKLDTMLEQVP